MSEVKPSSATSSGERRIKNKRPLKHNLVLWYNDNMNEENEENIVETEENIVSV
jgi:hypothetical protein